MARAVEHIVKEKFVQIRRSDPNQEGWIRVWFYTDQVGENPTELECTRALFQAAPVEWVGTPLELCNAVLQTLADLRFIVNAIEASIDGCGTVVYPTWP